MSELGFQPVCVMYQGNDSPLDGSYRLVCRHQIRERDFLPDDFVQVEDLSPTGDGKYKQALVMGNDLVTTMIRSMYPAQSLQTPNKLLMKRKRSGQLNAEDEHGLSNKDRDCLHDILNTVRDIKYAVLCQGQELSQIKLKQIQIETKMSLLQDSARINQDQRLIGGEDEMMHEASDQGLVGREDESRHLVQDHGLTGREDDSRHAIQEHGLIHVSQEDRSRHQARHHRLVGQEDSLRYLPQDHRLTGRGDEARNEARSHRLISSEDESRPGEKHTLFDVIPSETAPVFSITPVITPVIAVKSEEEEASITNWDAGKVEEDDIEHGIAEHQEVFFDNNEEYMADLLSKSKSRCNQSEVTVGNSEFSVVMGVEELEDVIFKTNNPASFAYRLAGKCFSHDEMIEGNTRGGGKRADGSEYKRLNPSAVTVITEEVKKRFPHVADEKILSRCVRNSINERARNERKKGIRLRLENPQEKHFDGSCDTPSASFDTLVVYKT